MASAAHITYSGQRLIPAPFVTITKEYNTNPNKKKVGSTFNITLNGSFIPYRGSPDASGNFYTGSNDDWTGPNDSVETDWFSALMRKKDALRALFSSEGCTLKIITCDTSGTMICNPRVVSINFPEGNWIPKIDYTIELQADMISGSLVAPNGIVLSPSGEDAELFNYAIESSEESWSIENGDAVYYTSVNGSGVPYSSYRVTHNVSAVGKRFYVPAGDSGVLWQGKEPWHWARAYNLSRIGYNTGIARSSGVMNLPASWANYNHIRSENIDIDGGSHSITESWIVCSGTVTEDFNVTVASGAQSSFATVSIEGSVNGLESIDYSTDPFTITTNKFTNANNYFNTLSIYSRANAFAGVSNLNPLPLNSNVGRNPTNGTVNYTYEFNDRPNNCITGVPEILFENIEITDINSTDVFASIPIIGRARGPVLQDMGTITAQEKGVSVEVVIKRGSYCTSYVAPTGVVSGVNNYILAVSSYITPNTGVVFKTEDNESWRPKDISYSRTVKWTYQSCGG